MLVLGAEAWNAGAPGDVAPGEHQEWVATRVLGKDRPAAGAQDASDLDRSGADIEVMQDEAADDDVEMPVGEARSLDRCGDEGCRSSIAEQFDAPPRQLDHPRRKIERRYLGAGGNEMEGQVPAAASEVEHPAPRPDTRLRGHGRVQIGERHLGHPGGIELGRKSVMEHTLPFESRDRWIFGPAHRRDPDPSGDATASR